MIIEKEKHMIKTHHLLALTLSLPLLLTDTEASSPDLTAPKTLNLATSTTVINSLTASMSPSVPSSAPYLPATVADIPTKCGALATGFVTAQLGSSVDATAVLANAQALPGANTANGNLTTQFRETLNNAQALMVFYQSNANSDQTRAEEFAKAIAAVQSLNASPVLSDASAINSQVFFIINVLRFIPGLINTQAQQIIASLKSYQAQSEQLQAQNKALDQQIIILRREIDLLTKK